MTQLTPHPHPLPVLGRQGRSTQCLARDGDFPAGGSRIGSISWEVHAPKPPSPGRTCSPWASGGSALSLLPAGFTHDPGVLRCGLQTDGASLDWLQQPAFEVGSSEQREGAKGSQPCPLLLPTPYPIASSINLTQASASEEPAVAGCLLPKATLKMEVVERGQGAVLSLSRC